MEQSQNNNELVNTDQAARTELIDAIIEDLGIWWHSAEKAYYIRKGKDYHAISESELSAMVQKVLDAIYESPLGSEK